MIGAVGIGLWSLIALSRAARHNLAQQQGHPGQGLLAGLWLAAFAGVLALAVASGFTLSVADQGAAIASGIIGAAGVAALAGSIEAARSRRMLTTRPVPTVVVGLVALAASFVVDAVVAGVVFGATGTFTGLRVGLSFASAVLLVGIAALGVAAWTRVGELVAPRGGYPPAGPDPATWPPPPSPSAGRNPPPPASPTWPDAPS